MIPITSKEMANYDPDKYGQLNPNYPAFTVTTGVYDFYMDNPFTIANHHAVISGQMLAILMAKTKLLNNEPVNLVGYSLGTVFVYSTCVALYDLGCCQDVNDVCLMGGCVDEYSLGQNIQKLVGSRGSIKGKLTILYTKYDSVLKYMFKSVRLGENPIGLVKVNFEFLADCLINQDDAFKDMSKLDAVTYLHTRIDNLDSSAWCKSHFAFKKKAHLILPHLTFNSDMRYFNNGN